MIIIHGLGIIPGYFVAKESELDVLYTISTILTWSTLSIIISKDDIPWHMSMGPINTCTMIIENP